MKDFKQFMKEASGDDKAYDAFFQKMLKKHGVDSIEGLKDEKAEKAFYDDVDAGWDADNEKNESQIVESKEEDYFENVVKRHLNELLDSIKTAKSAPAKNFYKNRYDVQLKDFSKALNISTKEIESSIK